MLVSALGFIVRAVSLVWTLGVLADLSRSMSFMQTYAKTNVDLPISYGAAVAVRRFAATPRGPFGMLTLLHPIALVVDFCRCRRHALRLSLLQPQIPIGRVQLHHRQLDKTADQSCAEDSCMQVSFLFDHCVWNR